MMKKIITIILVLFMSIQLFGQELSADDRVTITQSTKPFIGVYAFGYQGLPTPGYPQFQLNNYGGIPGSVTATSDNSILGMFAFSGHNGSAKKTVGVIRVKSMDDFETALNARIDFLIGPNREQRMTILGSSGYVGINTETPSTELDVDGQIRMRTGATAGYVPVADVDGVMTWTDPSTFSIPDLWTSTGGDVYRQTGNVGIGTILPSTELDVDGQIRMRTGAIAGYVPVANADGVMTWTDPNSFIPSDLWETNGTDVYRSTGNVAVASGNVSIGTTQSPSDLTIMKNINPEIRIGSDAFNNEFSGKLIFDENATDGNQTCGFELEHNGATDELSIITGCQLPNAGDTIAIFPRNGYNKFPVRLMVGSNDLPTSELDVDGTIRMRSGASNGYIPISDNNGEMTWTDPSNVFETDEISDADGNSKIQVEESNNENIIRFDANGTEIATMTSTRIGFGDTTPDYTFDLVHFTGTPNSAANGLNIENSVNGTSWTLYTWSSGNFSLHKDGSTMGTFNGTSGAYTTGSDRNLKKNIKILPSQMDKIMQLKPSSYQFKRQKDNSQYYGLISQEVQEVYPEFVSLIESVEEGGEKDLYGVSYSSFVPVLIAGLQEQHESLEEKDEAIEALNSKVSDLDDENTSLKNEVEELRLLVGQIQQQFTKYENDLQNCCINSNSDSNKESAITTIELNGMENQAQLEQNSPNPFNEQTIIKYYIPTDTKAAQMTITDIKGSPLKSVNLENIGFGTVVINANELPVGTYIYTLFVDGRKISSKQMILMK